MQATDGKRVLFIQKITSGVILVVLIRWGVALLSESACGFIGGVNLPLIKIINLKFVKR